MRRKGEEEEDEEEKDEEEQEEKEEEKEVEEEEEACPKNLIMIKGQLSEIMILQPDKLYKIITER